jgi:hypothetical protein
MAPRLALAAFVLGVVGCEASESTPPDFIGNYSPIHPYNTEGELSYVIRVLEGGRAVYEHTSCRDTNSESPEARWETRGDRLVFLPIGHEDEIFGVWTTDEAVLVEDGCGTASLSYRFPTGPTRTEERTLDFFRYEPCYVVDPEPSNGDEGVSGCLTVRCDDLPDCDFAL